MVPSGTLKTYEVSLERSPKVHIDFFAVLLYSISIGSWHLESSISVILLSWTIVAVLYFLDYLLPNVESTSNR